MKNRSSFLYDIYLHAFCNLARDAFFQSCGNIPLLLHNSSARTIPEYNDTTEEKERKRVLENAKKH